MRTPDDEPVHVTVPGCPSDPRTATPGPPGVVIHRGPPLHPDDVTLVHGIPVTTPSRTLVDLAEELTREELVEVFERARELGLLDIKGVETSARRVEWRSSLTMLWEVIDEFRA